LVILSVDGDRRVPCSGTPDCLFVQGRLYFWCKNYRILRVEGERSERREAQWRVTPRGGEHAVVGTLVNCGLDDRCSERAFMGDTSARRCLGVPTAATATGRIDHGVAARTWAARCSPCGTTTCRPHHGRPPAALPLVGAAPWPWRLARHSGLGNAVGRGVGFDAALRAATALHGGTEGPQHRRPFRGRVTAMHWRRRKCHALTACAPQARQRRRTVTPCTVRPRGGEDERPLEVRRRGVERARPAQRGVFSARTCWRASARSSPCSRISLGADLTFSTTRSADPHRRGGMQPEVQAVSVQTLEGGR